MPDQNIIASEVMSFFSELKRRNVFKVGVAYAIVAWLVLQMASILLPVFEAPAWVMRVFVLLLGAGFVVSLFIAWAFELTPEGIVPTKDVDPAHSITQQTGHKLNYVVITCLVLALLLMAGKDWLFDASSAPVAVAPVAAVETPPLAPAAESIPVSTVLPNSVAVLPFANLSPDENNAFFASGIHEELLNQLAKIRDLNVIARTSVLRFAGGTEDITAIAAALNVETVMEGSVRYADGNVRVTAQLIDATTNAHMWSETYTRPFENIFEIESEIAMAIAAALQAEFSLSEQASIAQQAPSSSPEAYALFVRALALWQSTGPIPEVLNQVLADMERVVALDPAFARPYAVMADINAELMFADAGTPDNWQLRMQQLEEQALDNADMALQLDPNLGYAYAAIGKIHQQYWREGPASAAFAKALELSPNDPEVLIENAWSHAFALEFGEAIRLAQRAVELDPNNSDLWLRLGMVYLMSRQQDDLALSAFERALTADSTNVLTYIFMAPILSARGDKAEGLAAMRIAETLLGGSPRGFILGEIALGYRLYGSPVDARRLFDQFSLLAQKSRIGPFSWAMAWLAIDDQKAALASLNEAAQNKRPDEGGIFMAFIKTNLFNDPVLDQPEFVEVRARLGYSEQQ